MNNLSNNNLEQALGALGAFLEDADAAHETLVVIGGSALISLGYISRTTRDVDVLGSLNAESLLEDPRPLSEPLRRAVEKVARELNLDPHWFNTGPASQVRAGLPAGFVARMTRRDYGTRLTICLPDRYDLIHLKLFAVMDRGVGRHTADLTALNPSDEEILAAARWVLTQDAGEVFPHIVRTALTGLNYGHLIDRL